VADLTEAQKETERRVWEAIAREQRAIAKARLQEMADTPLVFHRVKGAAHAC